MSRTLARAFVIGLGLCVVLTASAPAQSTAGAQTRKFLSATVGPDVRSMIARHWATGRDCRTQRITVQVTAPPANGTVTTATEQFVVPASSTLGGPQRCVGQSADSVAIYYQPRPGFSGQDSLFYLRINEDNAADRLNGEIVYTINVR